MTAPARPETTASEEIVLAADDLTREGRSVFSEWDLTVATWRRDKNRFGCRGYESDYPDHKRVMKEIMNPSNRNNPLRRSLIERVRPNHYQMTTLGRAEAARLRARLAPGAVTARSPADLYDVIEGLVRHRSFTMWRENPEEPRSWLGAAAFLGLSKNDADELHDRLRRIEDATRGALDWMAEAGLEEITRGPTGGGSGPIARDTVEALRKFSRVLQERFETQMAAIRKKTR